MSIFVSRSSKQFASKVDGAVLEELLLQSYGVEAMAPTSWIVILFLCQWPSNKGEIRRAAKTLLVRRELMTVVVGVFRGVRDLGEEGLGIAQPQLGCHAGRRWNTGI